MGIGATLTEGGFRVQIYRSYLHTVKMTELVIAIPRNDARTNSSILGTEQFHFFPIGWVAATTSGTLQFIASRDLARISPLLILGGSWFTYNPSEANITLMERKCQILLHMYQIYFPE